jgi:DNA polymerase-3 subunit epsilon
MRQVVVDTETTGLAPEEGHRVIEIGCVELLNRRLTSRRFHHYLQPDRVIDAAAMEVHGISDAFLADKPRFHDLADEFLNFIDGAELVIHNAPFDVGFLDHELGLLDPPRGQVMDRCTVLDTLALARELHPGQRNSLDALCKRYEVDNSHRDLHGALLDAEILADVYLCMTGGQTLLDLGGADAGGDPAREAGGRSSGQPRPSTRVVRASDAELAAHERTLDAIDAASEGRCLWRREDAASAD